MPNLLVELLVEELPPSYIEPALKQMKGLIKEMLTQNNLTYKDLGTEGTLRRLTLFVENLPDESPGRIERVRGPAASVAFADGKPTKAAIGFAQKFGLTPEELEIEKSGDRTYCVATVTIPGRSTLLICAEIIPQLIRSLRFPKSMRWDETNLSFARPIRNILALLGAKTVPLQVNNLRSSNTTVGHPFVKPAPIPVKSADFHRYIDSLRERFVILQFEERGRMLKERLSEAAARINAILDDEELLDEVTNMVEYPAVGLGRFKETYLSLPPVVIEATIKEHLRYFPLYKNGRPINAFLFIADRPESVIDNIKSNNERVVNARLEDARFYFQRDRKKSLKDFAERLDEIVFHESLGTYADVTERLLSLTEALTEHLDLTEPKRKLALLAASLAKADLATEMVAEFPSLQGRIGAEYARLDGIDRTVVEALAEQYNPAFFERALESPVAAVLAVADRLLNIVSFWAIGTAPTGAKDPFAIRRQTLTVIRILANTAFDVDIAQLVSFTNQLLPDAIQKEETVEEVTDFFRERIRSYLIDEGLSHNFADALLAVKALNIKDIKERRDALIKLSQKDIWRKLCETVERSLKISKKEKHTGEVNPELLFEKEERRLYELYLDTARSFKELLPERKYYEASIIYHNNLTDAIHHFFEKVFVYVDDKQLRRNRILLCLSIYRLYATNIADLSKIVFE